MEGTGLKSVKEMAAIRGLRVRENRWQGKGGWR